MHRERVAAGTSVARASRHELRPSHHHRAIQDQGLAVEPLNIRTRASAGSPAGRGHNLFLVPAAEVTFDFLTDSNTTAMSAAQWGAMLIADESAGSRNGKFERVVRELTGYACVIPTHQGRAADDCCSRWW
ncbi:MAG: beta-eliminating lyase-related protein [Planctomycetota bacterium]